MYRGRCGLSPCESPTFSLANRGPSMLALGGGEVVGVELSCTGRRPGSDPSPKDRVRTQNQQTGPCWAVGLHPGLLAPGSWTLQPPVL